MRLCVVGSEPGVAFVVALAAHRRPQVVVVRGLVEEGGVALGAQPDHGAVDAGAETSVFKDDANHLGDVLGGSGEAAVGCVVRHEPERAEQVKGENGGLNVGDPKVRVVRAASQSDSAHDLEGELAAEAVDGVAPGVVADRDGHGVVRHLSCHKGPDLFLRDVALVGVL